MYKEHAKNFSFFTNCVLNDSREPSINEEASGVGVRPAFHSDWCISVICRAIYAQTGVMPMF